MKKRTYITILLLLSLLFLATSCSITPDTMTYPPLTQEITKVRKPNKPKVISNNDMTNPSITITWDVVEIADYYVVEYISATDFLAGNAWNSLPVNSTTFTLPKAQLDNPSDMRFIFKVKACAMQNKKSIESPDSDEVEGVIINDFSKLKCYVRDNKLTVTVSYPNNNSVLDLGTKIITTTVKYYKGDYTKEPSKPIEEGAIDINSEVLTSAEEATYTAVLIVDNKEVNRKAFTVKNSVDNIPPSLVTMAPPIVGEVDGKPAITLSWESKPINEGLKDTELKFEIQRKVIDPTDPNANVWLPLRDKDGAIIYVSEQTYTDKDVLPNKDYAYRVVSNYFITVSETVYQYPQNYNSLLETAPVHLNDTKVASFYVSHEEDWKTTDVSGNATYSVDLAWSPIHELAEGYDYLVTRFRYKDFSVGDTSNGVLVYKGKETQYKDNIALNAEEDKKEHRYVYCIQIVPESATSFDIALPYTQASSTSGTVGGIIKTEATITPVSFIKTDAASLYVTGGDNALSDTIQIHWVVDDDALSLYNKEHEEQLDKIKVGVKIYRLDGATSTLVTKGYTTEDFVWYAEGAKPDVNGGLYFEDKLNIEPGKEYRYQIVVFYADKDNTYYGEQGLIDISGTGNVLDKVDIKAVSKNTYNDKIEVVWDPVKNATGYKIYYKETTSSDFVLAGNVNADKTSYSITGLDANKLYDITVTAKDRDDKDLIVQDNIMTGSILGAIQPKVENLAKSIKLSWPAVKNASIYTIKVYNSANKDDKDAFVTSIQIKDPELPSFYEYELKCDGDVINALLTTDPLALSKAYYFTVVPKSKEAEALETQELVKGSWNLAPTTVTASKAEYSDLITIKWDQVEGNEGYNIYKRSKDSNEPWTLVQYSTQNVNNLEDIKNIDGDYEYTVSTVVSGEEGPVQVSFTNESNVGYPILSPTLFSCTDQSIEGGDEYFIYTFKKVKDETKYKIVVGNDIIDLDISQPSTADSVTDPAAKVGTFKINEAGMVTYYGKRSDVTKSVYVDASIYTVGKNAAIADKTLSKAVSTTFPIKYVKDYEVVNILNNILNFEILAADNNFNGDWWKPNASKYTSVAGNGYLQIKCSGANWIGAQVQGEMVIGQSSLPYDYNNYRIETLEKVVLEARSEGGAGYLDTDPLDNFNNGKIIIGFPGSFKTKVVQFKGYKVDNSSGTVSVADYTNGEEGQYTEVDISKVSVKIL